MRTVDLLVPKRHQQSLQLPVIQGPMTGDGIPSGCSVEALRATVVRSNAQVIARYDIYRE